MFDNWMDSNLKNDKVYTLRCIKGRTDFESIHKYEKLVYNKAHSNISYKNKLMIGTLNYNTKCTYNDCSDNNILKATYNDTKKYYASVGRLIKNTLNQSELKSLKKYIRNHSDQDSNLIPLRYLLWRKICEGLNDIQSIDNGIKKTPNFFDSIKTPAHQFDFILNEIYLILKESCIPNQDIVGIVRYSFCLLVKFIYLELKKISTIDMHKNNENIFKKIIKDMSVLLIINKVNKSCALIISNK